jgi:hypothetical protein
MGPLVISILVGVMVIVALPDRVLFEGMQGATTRRGVPVEITSSHAIVALFERVRLSMGVVAAQPMLAAMLAGVLTLGFSKLMRWPAEFRQYLAVTTHAFLISALGAVLALVVQLATGRWEWSPSLGLLVPAAAGAETVFAHAASFANPFTIWMLVVIGIGVATINGRTRATLPVTVLLAGYLGLALGVGVIAG